MQLTWASFRLKQYLTDYWLLAQGGAAVTFLTWLCTHATPFPFLVNRANPVLEALADGVSNPQAFVLFVVLVLLLCSLALSGQPVVDFIARQVIRPALDLVQAATFVGTGVWFTCALLLQQGRLGYLKSACLLFSISVVLHAAVTVMDFYSRPTVGSGGIAVGSRISVNAMAIFALCVLFWALD